MNSYGSRPLGLIPGPMKTSSHMGAGVCRRGHGDVNKDLYGSMRPQEDDSEEFYGFDEFEEEFEGEEFDEEDDFYELVEFIDNQRW